MLRRDSSGRSSAERREGAWMSLRDRVTNILLRPSDEWRVIAREPSSVAELYLSYVAPLAAIGPLASIVGLSVIGYGNPVTGRIGRASCRERGEREEGVVRVEKKEVRKKKEEMRVEE